MLVLIIFNKTIDIITKSSQMPGIILINIVHTFKAIFNLRHLKTFTMKLFISVLCFSILCLFIVHPVQAQVDARMFRSPDISSTHIAFIYAGDIWVVEKEGGLAHSLSSPLGEEISPCFSPDGTKIAYTASYDGNPEVYVISSLGGLPKRITYHPMRERVVDWYPDSENLLINSSRESGRQRYGQFYKISALGGLAEKLPVPYGEYGTLSGDMQELAYTHERGASRNWKRYEGGYAADIWIFDLNSKDARRVTDHPATDADPMWSGDKIYFLSDRGVEKRQNIWVYSTGDESFRQVTAFSDFDIYGPSLGPQDMVFQAGDKLYRMDLDTETPVEVDITISTDLASIHPKLTNVSKYIQSFQIGPDGKRAVIEARGDVFTVPAEHGPIRNLTQTSGIAERYPAWSPDGKHVAYWSDRSGEYELCIRNGDGSGEEKQLTKLGPGFRYNLFWSPNSEMLAFIDNKQNINIFKIEEKKLIKVDFCAMLNHSNMQNFVLSWSENSEWLTYPKEVANRHLAIFLYNVTEETIKQVTSGYYSDYSPSFDPDGKYLYFLTNRSFSALYSDLDGTWVYPNATQIAAASLRADVPSLLAERNDEVAVKKDTSKSLDNDKKEELKSLVIETDNLESRIVILPVKAGNYNNLVGIKGQVLYTHYSRSGSEERTSSIRTWIHKDREEKTIISDAEGWELSADGKKILVANKGYGIIDVKPEQKIKTRLRTGEMEAMVNPRAEWHQVLADVWRKYRDYFYDENMHGLDWKAVKNQYDPLIEQALTRWDVTVILQEMIGELNSSHTYIFGPSPERPPSQQFGMLGVNWKLENGIFRIDRIIDGGAWDSELRSPLSVTGVKIKEGDYVLAVNGIPLDAVKEPWASFQGLANRAVELTINDKPSFKGSSKHIIKTLANETRLRNLEWMEKNRLYVEKKSGGRIGYIYMPNTGGQGQTQLVKQLYAQMDKDAIIIDERFNSGGQLSDRFLEFLLRPRIGYIYSRNGNIADWPDRANFGPKAMLINGWSASGGDALPFGFKILEAGPIVGTRTGGALIGPAMGHSNIDNGGHTVPSGRIMGKDGQWFSEGHGVEPDYMVVADPSKLAKGVDPQMDKAIELLLEELEKNPPAEMNRPAFEER
jgi:tricorn protease